MKVVFDTNVLISALHFKGSTPRKILQLADIGLFKLLISKQIISELRGVLRVKFQYDKEMLDVLETLLLSFSELVEPKKKVFFIKDDREDNKILECAQEGKVNFIVSGDKHLLRIKEFLKIKIIKPRELLKLLEEDL